MPRAWYERTSATRAVGGKRAEADAVRMKKEKHLKEAHVNVDELVVEPPVVKHTLHVLSLQIEVGGLAPRSVPRAARTDWDEISGLSIV